MLKDPEVTKFRIILQVQMLQCFSSYLGKCKPPLYSFHALIPPVNLHTSGLKATLQVAVLVFCLGYKVVIVLSFYKSNNLYN